MKKIKTILFFSLTFFATALYSQTNTWTWKGGDSLVNQFGIYGTMGVSSPNSLPGGRAFGATWTDAAGNFWLFGGGGYSTQLEADLNDLWKYNPSSNQWTWVKGSNVANSAGSYGVKGVAAASNVPPARDALISWQDNTGNFWIFSGERFQGFFNDLWKYNPLTNEWTWMKGDSTTNSSVPHPGVYGTLGVASSANNPGDRLSMNGWTDAGGNLWIFGGIGYDEFGNGGNLNDLWKYDISTNQWTWIKGSKSANDAGSFGTQGVPLATNNPPGRAVGATWRDGTGNLWLLGGLTAGNTLLNDLWKYNVATNIWTWVKGSNAANQPGVYGQAGVPQPSSIPGGRALCASWTGQDGNLWLANGAGIASTASLGPLSDVWKYNPSINEWAWMNGSDTIDATPVYGNMGTASPFNTPGSRYASAQWLDNAGDLLLFGGLWKDPGSNDSLFHDVWKYTPDYTTVPVHLTSFQAKLQHTIAHLRWTVENEINFDRYEVERSSNGRQFNQIESVTCKMQNGGTNEYSYADDLSRLTSHLSRLYYRLKMVDKDGSFTYSKTVMVNIAPQAQHLRVYPNPVRETLFFECSKMNGTASFRIINSTGKVVRNGTIELNG